MMGKCPVHDKVGHFVKVCRSRKMRGNILNATGMDKVTSEEWTHKQYDDTNSDLFIGMMQGVEKEEVKL